MFDRARWFGGVELEQQAADLRFEVERKLLHAVARPGIGGVKMGMPDGIYERRLA